MEFLPHRPPFLMIDRLDFVDDREVRAGVVVAQGMTLLERDGTLHPVALAEIVAQAWAAATGYRKAVAGLPPQTGLLVSLRSVEFPGRAAVGDRLTVAVTLETAVNDFLIVDGSVRRGDETLARASITLWSGDQPAGEA
jgi:predicted hotdog family 3-hydroxylacyl-ACP dehydratase